MIFIGVIIILMGGIGLGIGLRDLYFDKTGKMPDNDAEYVSIIAYSILIVILGIIPLATAM